MIRETKTTWRCPSGYTWDLCNEMLEQTHMMIGGTTGSGKSTLLHSLIYTALIHSPARIQFVLIDLKGVELRRYRNLPHTIAYADEPMDAVNAIETTRQIMRNRLAELKRTDDVIYKGNDIYLIIDEMAVLMQTAKAKVLAPLAEIMRLGRATKIHVISATQNPNRSNGGGCPSEIAQNVTASIALRCRSRIESNILIGKSSAETLPIHGKGYFWNPGGIDLVAIPKTDEDDLKFRINYWLQQKPQTQKEERKWRWFGN